MNILVTLNSNYIKPLKVMLWSLFFNNRGRDFHVYLIHSSLTPQELEDLREYINSSGHEFSVIKIPAKYFADAPVVKHYSQEMYYRLLAHRFLPEDLDRILYLDPDILVINPINELYETEMKGYLYAASYHKRALVKGINMIRLKAYEMQEYFNSGVLLMNLPLHREKIREEEIFAYLEKNRNRLILPDQDLLNALYSKEIKKVDEVLYNYDTRFYYYYRIQSNGRVNMDYIMDNTVILHFCGKKKPWQEQYTGEFHSLYKHYERLALGKKVLGSSAKVSAGNWQRILITDINNNRIIP
ncbi:MAG: glycosyltransferase family 8 protein [Firmicutes bacterium]|jgi:lipopolysaccharide biosynthesis glycosyltransferase|nr:glycosyltransferase family 8 protein [Bacillota bacterium]